jgi:hypothetical protein
VNQIKNNNANNVKLLAHTQIFHTTILSFEILRISLQMLSNKASANTVIFTLPCSSSDVEWKCSFSLSYDRVVLSSGVEETVEQEGLWLSVLESASQMFLTSSTSMRETSSY